MTLSDADLALRRFERDAVAACLATAAVAFVAAVLASGLDLAGRVGLGVLGGGLLTGFSYRAIKGAANLVMRTAEGAGAWEIPGGGAGPEQGQPRSSAAAGDDRSEQDFSPARRPVLSGGRKVFLGVKFFTRYALLAVAAYVMLACFRLHPVGLVAGATAPFLAAVMQAGRLSRASGRRPRR